MEIHKMFEKWIQYLLVWTLQGWLNAMKTVTHGLMQGFTTTGNFMENATFANVLPSINISNVTSN